MQTLRISRISVLKINFHYKLEEEHDLTVCLKMEKCDLKSEDVNLDINQTFFVGEELLHILH